MITLTLNIQSVTEMWSDETVLYLAKSIGSSGSGSIKMRKYVVFGSILICTIVDSN